MKELVALIDRSSEDWLEVEIMLQAGNHRIHQVQSLEDLQLVISEIDCGVVIIDLDLVTIHNRFFRSLKSSNPHLNILAISSRPYHPDLDEAMTNHICACFRKPLDTEEIEFWLRALMRSAPSRDPTI